MSRLEYEKLNIATSFINGQDYLDITGRVQLTDESIGFSREGGCIRAFVISSRWTSQSFTELTAGMDEKLYNCANCLEAHNLGAGTAAFIVGSEFVASEREHEERAFIDLDSFLQDVLGCEIIVTFLPFNPELKRRQGYTRIWGPDKRSYSIKYDLGEVVQNAEIYVDYDETELGFPNANGGPLLNKLRSVSMAEAGGELSEGAMRIVNFFKENGNAPFSKEQIMDAIELQEDDLSFAMMELLNLDLLVELEGKEEVQEMVDEETAQESEHTDIQDGSFLQAVLSRQYDKVRDLLWQPGVQINEVDGEDRNALFIALDNRDIEMVKLLLEAGIDPNFENEDGLTAIKMCWLIRFREAEVLLREHGAELDL